MISLIERLRTLLILGRVSNLPTVWSNLLAGWVLADVTPISYFGPKDFHGPDATMWLKLPVLLGGSFLYIGGMYLNDYCDVDFDARYSPARPIPAGKISRRIVGFLSALWFTAGFACFTSFGPMTMGAALLLISTIVLYDFHHKNVAWAPLLMGFCRCLLYLLAASSVRESWYFGLPIGNWWDHALTYVCGDCWPNALQVIQWMLPSTIPLGLYVAGLSYLARGESRPGKPTRWALFLLLVPVAAAIGQFWLRRGLRWEVPQSGLLFFGLLLLGWMAWLLVPLWRKINRSIGRVVSGLLAGIVLVDIVAVTPVLGFQAAWFLILFVLALLLQRIIPAT